LELSPYDIGTLPLIALPVLALHTLSIHVGDLSLPTDLKEGKCPSTPKRNIDKRRVRWIVTQTWPLIFAKFKANLAE
jgi:hypothetical protein